MSIAALDPGRDKCGLAILSQDGTVLCQRVIETRHLITEITTAKATYGFSRLIMGNGTTSKEARQKLAAVPDIEILIRDEYRTTEMAKGEYWRAHPPTGWRRLLPVTMQVPPVPVDDFVAVILGRRFLQEEKESKEHGAE